MFWTKTIVSSFIFFVVLQSTASADMAYMVTSQADFGTIDLNSGVFSLTAPQPVLLSGLGEIGSTLYGSSYDVPGTGILYTVNPTTGALTSIGAPTSVEYNDFGSTLTHLYAVDLSANLYSIDPATGAAHLIGPTGLALGFYQNLSTNSSTLYFANGANLYTLDTTTGSATLVGNMNGPQMGALMMDGSVLYGGQDSGVPSVDTLNLLTGTATVGPSLSSGPDGIFFGLAAIATPEPRTVSWLLLCLLAGGVWVQRRLSNRSSKQQSE